MDVPRIVAAQREFARERKWGRYHVPKNLVMALAGEVGELVELFQWLTPEEARRVMTSARKARQVRDELADILYYLVRLADVLNVDLERSFWDKMRTNAEKYPVHRSRGSSRKYTDY